jgi:hypothetical protein
VTYYWFSTYTGNRWTPDEGYNETFRQQVVLLRNWFQLKRAGVGREESTGYWREYELRGKTVYITVDSFSWNGYTQGYTDFYDFHYNQTPVFSLEYRISEKPKGKRVILMDRMTIKFPERFPSSPPAYFTKTGGKHIFYDGWMCILGHTKNWGRNDTIISGLNAAFDLIVYNIQRNSLYSRY